MSRDSSSDPFDPIKISTIIEDATSITMERYKLNSIIFKINYHGSSQQVSITCQRLQISQIIINLLNNAFDAVNAQIDKKSSIYGELFRKIQKVVLWRQIFRTTGVWCQLLGSIWATRVLSITSISNIKFASCN